MHKDDLRKAMRLYRHNNNISQSKLAKMLDVSQATVNTWEAGKGMPSGKSYESLMALINEQVEEKEIDPVEVSMLKRLFQHFTPDEMPIVGKVLSRFQRK